MWNYCSKQDVANYTGISKDDILDEWSTEVEDLIDQHIPHSSWTTVQTYTESLDGDGTDTIYLSYRPIASVTSLAIDDTSVASANYKVYDSWITLSHDTDTALSDSINAPRATFPKGQQNVTVTYTAGYSSAPGRVRLCAKLMVSELARINQRAGSDASLSISMSGSQNVGDRSSWTGDVTSKLKRIMTNTLGTRWNFA